MFYIPVRLSNLVICILGLKLQVFIQAELEILLPVLIGK